MFEVIEKLQAEAREALEAARDSQGAEQFRAKFLGAKGAVKDLMARLKDVEPAHKPEFGKRANELRQQLEAGYQELVARVGAIKPPAAGAKTALDVTEPGLTPIPGGLGRMHVITQTTEDLIEIFGRMGFDVATGPEVEDEWHNFEALNIPAAHPARDPLDNFYLEATGDPRQATGGGPHANAGAQNAPGGGGGGAGGGGGMVRSQTSTIQIRVMEKTQPPVRVVAMGRVYRPDEHDATHSSMFHQVEGLYVDRQVSMVDLKTTLLQFARAYFGPDTEVRLRPSFFPFTEPSAEMDVKIHLRGQWRWMELGGCGMVHPAVLESVGYDSETWTGFAFGLGIERLAMRKYGISDIRWLFENDVRFLRQF